MYNFNINIPEFNKGNKIGSYDCKDNCMMYVYADTNKQDYEEYIKRLEQEGYVCYDKQQMKENYHATFTKDENYVIHIYFTTCDLTTRIIIDSNTRLYQTQRESANGEVLPTMLYQFELDYRNVDCGMCYVTRCEDGSFFIVDSAHQDSVNDHIRLHSFLRSLTPDGQPIMIAGWFFSHAHQDHITKFMDFIEAGFDDYKIECLYYNFPALTTEGNEKWHEYDKVTMREFDELIEKHTELKKVKLHTGQRFYIRNLAFEVLATHEDVYPHDLARYNDSSTVLRMIVDGCKILFLGDANIKESEILVQRYGDYLKSDIVQISHHGYNGATVEVYECTDAQVALFPVVKYRLEDNLYREPNQKALELCKEHYIGSEGTVGLTLPYELGTAKLMKREITE